MSVFEQLKIKVEKDTGYKLKNIERTYASAWQKGTGSFVWIANNADTNAACGSSHTATELLKRETISIQPGPGLTEFI